MKTILMIRHAKSQLTALNNDFTKILTEKGINDAKNIASLISKKITTPDIIYTRPAYRALMTAKIFAEQLHYPENKLISDINIYQKGLYFIKHLLPNIDNKINLVSIVGHNPDVAFLVSYYTGKGEYNVPTSSAICIDFYINKWQEINDKKGEIRFFYHPKNNI